MRLMQDDNSKTVQLTGNKFVYGVRNVATAGTAVKLLADNTKTLAVYIKADAGNSSTIYVGDDDVDATNGYPLADGEEVFLWVDNNEEAIYIDAADSNKDAKYIAWSAE